MIAKTGLAEIVQLLASLSSHVVSVMRYGLSSDGLRFAAASYRSALQLGFKSLQ